MLESAKGFTIVEVSIFLAVSGLLLLTMFIGTGSMVSRQRFTDTTDSLQTFFQSQYDEVVNGVNVSTAPTECGGATGASGQSTCLLVGKLLTIPAGSTTISSNYIISTTTPTNTSTPQAELSTASLKVINTGASTYELKWGAQVSNVTRSSDRSTASVNTAAFIRLPSSGRIVQLYYSGTSDLTAGLNGTGAPPTTGIKDSNVFNQTADATGSIFAVCVKSADNLGSNVRSAILFSGQGAGAITTSYQPAAGLGC